MCGRGHDLMPNFNGSKYEYKFSFFCISQLDGLKQKLWQKKKTFKQTQKRQNLKKARAGGSCPLEHQHIIPLSLSIVLIQTKHAKGRGTPSRFGIKKKTEQTKQHWRTCRRRKNI